MLAQKRTARGACLTRARGDGPLLHLLALTVARTPFRYVAIVADGRPVLLKQPVPFWLQPVL